MPLARRLAKMRTTAAFLLVAMALIAAGCGGAVAPSSSPRSSIPPTLTPGATGTPAGQSEPTVSATPSPSEPRHGIQGLVDDLTDAGVDAAVRDTFDGEPLAVQQTIVCADGEDVRVFVYGSEPEAAMAAAMIDPNDPTNIGTAIVEWDGWPKFWQRDRIIVLYLGRDEATIETLTNLMGERFAEGRDGPRRLPAPC